MPTEPTAAKLLAEQREHAEWVRDYLGIKDMDGISAHSLNGWLLVVLDLADQLLTENEELRGRLADAQRAYSATKTGALD